MIWIVFLVLMVIAGFYLMRPFLGGIETAQAEGLDQVRRQRATVDQDESDGRISPDAAQEARNALDRRILAVLDSSDPDNTGSRLSSLAWGIVPAVLLLGGVGIYTQIGSPNYQSITVAQYQAAQVAELPDTLEELTVVLKARLEADPNPPADGYVLLARSYLRIGDVEAGLSSYETAINLAENASEIVAERDRVIQILQERSTAPQIDPDARTRIEAMSPEDQAAMIGNMVDGLAIRLEQDPNDFEGWMRLIRARAVMGNIDQAQQDLAAAQAVFPIGTEQGAMLERLGAELLHPPTDSAQE